MKKLFPLILVLASLSAGYVAIADDVQQKTDGSFVGQDTQPASSSFVGDDSSSVENDSFVGENTEQDTDSQFVGANTIQSENSEFSGQTYHQQVSTSTVGAFAQDGAPPQTNDGAFAGQDTQNQTDGSFDGDDYGK